MTDLTSPVTGLKGIGKETAGHLEALGIETIADLLWTFPHRHEDFRLKDLAQTPHNERVTVECKVEREPTILFLGRNKSRLQVTVLAGRHLVKVVFFNQGYLKQKLIPGAIITVTGKWDRGRQVINGTSVTFGPKTEQVDFEPVYSLKGLIPQKRFRKYIRQALDDIGAEIPDAIPLHIQEAYKLAPIADGLEGIHFLSMQGMQNRLDGALPMRSYYSFSYVFKLYVKLERIVSMAP